MRRANYNGIGEAKEYLNGNITLKVFGDSLEEFTRDEVLEVSELLSLLDCTFIGDTFCLNNFETGHLVYNYYSDVCYIFPWSLLEELKAGKVVRIYARKPDKDVRELIEEEE